MLSRSFWSTFLLIAGLILLMAGLGQYGYMAWRQHQLREQWFEAAGRAASGPRPAPADAAPPGLRLVIPSIHLDDIVVRGTAYNDLLVAPGLLEGSPLPSAGGNTVIAAHRDTFFRRVHRIQLGAEIEVDSGGRRYRYRVFHREIVKPTDVGVLAPTPQPRLTLVTCYPTYWIGPAPDRLILQARLESPYQ